MFNQPNENEQANNQVTPPRANQRSLSPVDAYAVAPNAPKRQRLAKPMAAELNAARVSPVFSLNALAVDVAPPAPAVDAPVVDVAPPALTVNEVPSTPVNQIFGEIPPPPAPRVPSDRVLTADPIIAAALAHGHGHVVDAERILNRELHRLRMLRQMRRYGSEYEDFIPPPQSPSLILACRLQLLREQTSSLSNAPLQPLMSLAEAEAAVTAKATIESNKTPRP
jgi:hypothetical protein